MGNSQSDFSIIVTLGPSILNDGKLSEIDSLGNCIYRINGAHVDAEAVFNLVSSVRKILPESKILVDLPGNKIRTSNLIAPIRLTKGESISLTPYQLNFPTFYSYLNRGDIILAADATLRLEVLTTDSDEITLISHSDGLLENNKGLHVAGIHKDIPFLFERDLDLINAFDELKLEFLSLSFVRDAKDVQLVKEIFKERGLSPSSLIAKIETESAVANIAEILEEVDIANIDRGDLSSDIGLLQLPLAQQQVVEAARGASKKLFLATQFLKNMETNPVPLIAELTSLYDVFGLGVCGIQLSEETAVGKYPVECVKLVVDLQEQFFLKPDSLLSTLS